MMSFFKRFLIMIKSFFLRALAGRLFIEELRTLMFLPAFVFLVLVVFLDFVGLSVLFAFPFCFTLTAFWCFVSFKARCPFCRGHLMSKDVFYIYENACPHCYANIRVKRPGAPIACPENRTIPK